MANLTQVIL